MSQEIVRHCDMEDCQEGKYIHECSKCGADVCSLCVLGFKDENICMNCARKMIKHADIEKILARYEKVE